MAKKTYIGVGGVARKVKKGYVGIGGVARKIKKAYIGVGGVARPCWSGGTLVYYGAVTPLNTSTFRLAAASNENFALFCGGHISGGATAVTTAYNKSLVASSAPALTTSKGALAATKAGGYALFGGGGYMTTSFVAYQYKSVDAYDASLVKTSAPELTDGGWYIAGANNGEYAIFAGGLNGGSSAVDAYSSGLVKSQLAPLSTARAYMGGAFVGDYCIFAGGKKSSFFSDAFAYNRSLTQSTISSLSSVRCNMGATAVGNYALFCGGLKDNTTGGVRTIDVYNGSLTLTTLSTGLTTGVESPSAVTIDGFAIIAGGVAGGSVYPSAANVYDDNLTKLPDLSIQTTRKELAACAIGNYALFGGGINNSTRYSNVEAFTTL